MPGPTHLSPAWLACQSRCRRWPECPGTAGRHWSGGSSYWHADGQRRTRPTRPRDHCTPCPRHCGAACLCERLPPHAPALPHCVPAGGSADRRHNSCPAAACWPRPDIKTVTFGTATTGIILTLRSPHEAELRSCAATVSTPAVNDTLDAAAGPSLPRQLGLWPDHEHGGLTSTSATLSPSYWLVEVLAHARSCAAYALRDSSPARPGSTE
jgi:hypothetical protein